jgi:poly(3-hydroxybutyrate) depolymerase
MMASALDVFAHAAAPRGKPEFNLPVTTIAGKQVVVVEEIEASKPFGQLKHFTKPDASSAPAPNC